MRFKYPEIPFPRSCLAPLEPIGLGTTSAESVESYVLRLAKEHRVTRYHIESLVSKSGLTPLYQGTSRQPFRVDSPIENAKEFARRLALLTHMPAVETMGLGWLAGKVAFMGALRDHRAWCPQCIWRCQATGSLPYLPLVWSLPSYEVCLVHGGSMQSSCPSCSERINGRREWAWPFANCPHCSCSLARPESTAGQSLRDLERRKIRGIDQRAAINLGELISKAQGMKHLPLVAVPDVTRLVASGIARGRADHASDLAALAGVPKSTLHGLAVARSSRPSLDILARLSVAADVSIVGTLCPSLWREGSAVDEKRTFMPVSPRRERPRVSWDAVRRATNAELRSAKPDSPSGLARRLGVDPSHLRNTFPEAAKKLAALYRATKASERETARAELVVRIREHLEDRSRAGRRVSLRAASASLNVHRHNEDFRAAWTKCQAKE